MYNQKTYELGTNRSVIRELAEYGKQRAAIVGPENVFDFSIGNPSIPAPARINDTIREILLDTDSLAIHSYTSATGNLDTRQAIADDLNDRFGTSITPQELTIGCGTSQELVAVFTALSVENSEILTIAPYFPEYQVYVEHAGSKFKVVPADIPGFQINLEALESMLNPNTVAVIINSPNNPSGAVYSAQTLEHLACILTRKAAEYGHPIYIVADEPYRELVYGKPAPFIPTIYRDTIVCYSYSKSLSLPGERIGYIYIPRQATDSEALAAAISGGTRLTGHICAPSLLQQVIARCATLRPDMTAYAQNRKALSEGLRAAGYEMAEPDGAFYLFVKAPGGDAMAFCEKAMAKDVLVVPGDIFGCPGYLRVCYCVSYDTILKALPIFRELNK
ncbi:MAG: pyridoxal phosphate-dependent aminotransferase [Oscillospiraceae bacterium]|nr:pyridoxal phosphate-dependent aminotransferase [Oscillospiraceae bacterium]